jgi:class 3 adenylate cyclase/YHS domain-containing protein
VRVRRSFCFVDLSGFTALTNRSGDEQAVAVLTSFRAAVRDICSRRGVRIAKWLGDGAMLVSVETTPVVACALELLFRSASRPVAVRCGITTGQVILLEGDDYIGHCVNVAARLCDLASGGEIFASTDMRAYLPPWAVVFEEPELMLRGLDHPVQVLRLGVRGIEDCPSVDPVCGLPLSGETAFEMRQVELGEEIYFCSDSCLETWTGRLDVSAL